MLSCRLIVPMHTGVPRGGFESRYIYFFISLCVSLHVWYTSGCHWFFGAARLFVCVALDGVLYAVCEPDKGLARGGELSPCERTRAM